MIFSNAEHSYYLKENGGHGSEDQDQQIEHQERMLRFAYRVLG